MKHPHEGDPGRLGIFRGFVGDQLLVEMTGRGDPYKAIHPRNAHVSFESGDIVRVKYASDWSGGDYCIVEVLK
jgi:hypothetical protein